MKDLIFVVGNIGLSLLLACGMAYVYDIYATRTKKR